MTNRFGSPGSQVPQAPRLPKVPEPPGVDPFPAPDRLVIAPRLKVPKDAEELRQERFKAFLTTRNMSYPEFICWEYLTQKKKLEENVDFVYTLPVSGGRGVRGGLEIDFYIPMQRLAWLVQGLEWHYVDPSNRARDLLVKAILSGKNMTVVDVFEDDVIQRTTLTLDAAWEGRQISRNG